MTRSWFPAVAVCMWLTAPGISAAADPPRYEAWLGAGGATGFEKNVFNTPTDLASRPEAAVSLGFLWNLDARRAVGLHLYGATETTPEMPAPGASGSQFVRYDLTTTNLGVRYRHAFPRGALVPYVFAGVNLASGLLETPASTVTGVPAYENFAYGVSGCVGPGIGVRLGRNFMLSAEGIGSFGVASWETPPVAASTGKAFNPSLLAGTINLTVGWGVVKPRTPAVPPDPVAPAASDSSLAAAGATRATGPTGVGAFLLFEGSVLFYSTAAYVDDKGALLCSVTAVAAVLGTAAGGSSSESATRIMLYGLLSLAALELGLGQAGATNDALFATSAVGWNVLAFFALRAEKKDQARR